MEQYFSAATERLFSPIFGGAHRLNVNLTPKILNMHLLPKSPTPKDNKSTVMCFTMAACLAAFPLQAADQDVPSDSNPWQWLEGQRDQVSRNVTALGRNLDAWLAGEGVGDQGVNETYLRVRLNQQLGSLDGYQSRVKIGGSLDLPRLSERWKLIFESSAEELKALEESVLGNETSDTAAGAFQFFQISDDEWQVSHSVGLRGRVPVDPFYRFKAQHNQELNTDWTLGFRQRIWHYKSQGWGYKTDVSFDRKIVSGKILRISSQVKYQQNHNLTEFSQSIGVHNVLGQYETLSYEFGILGTSKPNVRVNDYYIGTRYRRAIKDDWLFLEMLPQLVVSRDENWRPEPRLIINLEVLFFDF